MLSAREIEVLSYTLDHYVPYKTDVRRLEVEFERFYEDILPHTTHFDPRDKILLKSKFLNTFHKLSKIKITNEDERVIDGLSKNKNIIIF